MIRVYPSMLPGDPLETHDTTQTLGGWLAGNVPDYDPIADSHPIVVKQGGHTVDPALWQALEPSADNPVDIYIAPHSGAVDAIGDVFEAVIGVFQSVFSFLMPDVPDVGGANRERGSEIERVDVSANGARLNAVVPNQAGRFRTFPDYLNEPRRYFASPREQVLEMFLCLGAGEYDVETENLRIGETPLDALGSTVDYQIFAPGADVSGRPEHRVWYNVPEVGASAGSSGLRLRGASASGAEYDGSGTSGDQRIQVNDGDRPVDWTEGLVIKLRLWQEITVGSNGTSIFGDFRHLSDGDQITIPDTPFSGIYRVRSVSTSGMLIEDVDTGDLIDTLPPGDYETPIDRTNYSYEIVERLDDPRQVSLQRIDQDGNIDPSWAELPSTTGVRMRVFVAEGGLIGLYTGPFQACPRDETTNLIEWDVFCPNGLGYVEDDGTISERSIDVELQWSDDDGATWNTVTKTVTGSSRDQLGFTFAETIPSSAPRVRTRRLTAEDNSVQALDRIEWYGLRSELPTAKTSYPEVTVMAITISASDTISSQTDNQINVTQTRKLNGTTTRSIADYLQYVLDDAGLDADEIDSDEIDRLALIWDGRGDTFDFIHGKGETVHDVIKRILRAGMSEYTLSDGRITPVRDELRTTFEHMYTPQNMTESGLTRTVTPLRGDDVDGVDVTFTSAESWTRETVECRLPGDAGIRAEKITLDGVTDRTQAWRIGMRLRAAMRHRRRAYSFGTEMDALNSRYWSYVALADDVPGYTQTGLILDVSGTSTVTVTTSEPLEWQSGETHVIAWRRPDGTLAGPYTATQGTDDYTVTFTGDAPIVDCAQELPHYMFGVSQRFAYPAIIQSISPQGFESVNVEAVNYDARVYDYDDQEPPA